jgi:hypothetical protein
VVGPLNAPSGVLSPSPQLITTLRMFAVAETATLKSAGCPAATGVAGPVMPIPVRGFNPTTSAVDVFPATVAVTLDSRVVVSVARATPDESVVEGFGEIAPVVAVNCTGTPATGSPDTSSTRAEISAVPPLGPSV